MLRIKPRSFRGAVSALLSHSGDFFENVDPGYFENVDMVTKHIKERIIYFVLVPVSLDTVGVGTRW